MLDSPGLTVRNKHYLLVSGLMMALAALMLFLYFSEISYLGTLMVSIFGLTCMGIALYIVISSSSHPLASIGLGFVFVLALQHGVGWILELIFTEQHYSRVLFFTDNTLAKSVALAGSGLLAFACTYGYYNAQKRRNNLDADCAAQSRNSTIDQIPWSILLILVVGILIFEIGGGINLFREASTFIYLVRSVFGYLSKIVIILISLKLLASRLKTPIIYLILMVLWAGFVFLTGQRQYIVAIGLVTCVLAFKWRLTTAKVGQIVEVVLFVLLIMVGMVYLRDIFGRSSFTNMTLSEQLAVISEGRTVDHSNVISTLKYDLGYRLNAGNILLGLMTDLPGVDMFWVEPVTFSAESLVPGIIWADKAEVFRYNLPRLISNHYGLSNKGDYIVTFITVFYAMGGVSMLILLTGLCGVIVAFLDTRVAKSTSVLSLILTIGLAYGLLSIDHSIDLLFIALRDAFVLYLLIKASIIINHVFRQQSVA